MLDPVQLVEMIRDVGLPMFLAAYFIYKDWTQGQALVKTIENNTVAIRDIGTVTMQVNNTLGVMTKEIERLQDDVNELKHCAKYS